MTVYNYADVLCLCLSPFLLYASILATGARKKRFIFFSNQVLPCWAKVINLLLKFLIRFQNAKFNCKFISRSDMEEMPLYKTLTIFSLISFCDESPHFLRVYNKVCLYYKILEKIMFWLLRFGLLIS